MDRYARLARWYDAFSGEPLYRNGRRLALPGLRLRPGARVLDLGCGTGLDLPGLVAGVGPSGTVVGVDRSRAMLDVAAAKVRRHGWPGVRLVPADLTRLTAADLAGRGVEVGDGLDAALATYAFSVTGDAAGAWAATRGLLRPGARVAVVDLQAPTGAARVAAPVALAACRMGGADPRARPWQVVAPDLVDVRRREVLGGHVVVQVGTWPGPR